MAWVSVFAPVFVLNVCASGLLLYLVAPYIRDSVTTLQRLRPWVRSGSLARLALPLAHRSLTRVRRGVQMRLLFGLVALVHAALQCAVHPLGLFVIQSMALFAKAQGWTHASWWVVLVPLLVPWGLFAVGAVGLASAVFSVFAIARISPRCRTRVTECVADFFVWKPRTLLVVVSLLLINAVFVPAFLSVVMTAAT